MKFFSVADFAKTGSAQLPAGKWRAAGIAACSEVDICDVGGFRLGPMAVVPASSGVEVRALRGFRTGVLQATVDDKRLGGTLVLQLYEDCDQLVPPGPRATYYASASKLLVGAGNEELMLRIPFSGRKFAVVSFKWANLAENWDLSCIVRGVRYHSAAQCKVIDITTVKSIVEQATTETLFDGGGAIPASTVDDTTSTELGKIFYVGGGGDNQEGFDELEIWCATGGGGGSDGTALVSAEACGERG